MNREKITIGMLREKDKGFKNTAITFSNIAGLYDVNFFYFRIGDVDFDKKIINGRVYKSGKWIRKKFSYPDIIYNENKTNNKLYNKLENEVIFTSHYPGNKNKVHRLLEKDKILSKFLIPTEKYKSEKQIHDFLDEENEIVLKPSGGNKGKGIIFIEKVENNNDSLNLNNTYRVIFNKNEGLFEKEELDQFIKSNINNEYIIQPFINSKTKDGLPFDIRAHLQKNGKGKWVVTRLYARVGYGDGIVSNDGYIGIIYKFLRSEFGNARRKQLEKKIENFSLSFVERFQSLYTDSFDEIGLDLTINENEDIYLFEVNAKPGHQGGFLAYEVLANYIPYAKYLVNSYRPKRIDISKNDARELKIFFGGNTLIDNVDIIKSKGYSYPFQKINKLYNSADLVSLQLTGSIIEHKDSEKDVKYVMQKKVVNTFKAQGIHLFGLANSNIINADHQRLSRTIDLLSEAGVTTLGAGKTEMNARSGVEVVKNNTKVGMLNYMVYNQKYHEHYNFYSYHETSGFASLEEKKVSQDIAYLRRKGISSIVISVNWGSSSTSMINKNIEMLINIGADAILGYGENSDQSIEIRQGIPVFHELGDFISVSNDFAKFEYSYPIELSFEQGKLQKVQVFPVYNGGADKFRPLPLKGNKAKRALKKLQSVSELKGVNYTINKDSAEIRFVRDRNTSIL